MWGVILIHQPLMMKTKPKIKRIKIWVMLGLAILFTGLALNRPLPVVQEATTTPTAMTDTTDATPNVQKDVGSTDWIMLIAAMIVLIVIAPILLRRSTWANGKPKT